MLYGVNFHIYVYTPSFFLVLCGVSERFGWLIFFSYFFFHIWGSSYVKQLVEWEVSGEGGEKFHNFYYIKKCVCVYIFVRYENFNGDEVYNCFFFVYIVKYLIFFHIFTFIIILLFICVVLYTCMYLCMYMYVPLIMITKKKRECVCLYVDEAFFYQHLFFFLEIYYFFLSLSLLINFYLERYTENESHLKIKMYPFQCPYLFSPIYWLLILMSKR